MGCEIKNEKCPVQIQCFFPTAADDTRPFALYFHPSQGIQERVLYCAYNGHDRCFNHQGFKETHDGFNNVTITVSDTFSQKEGFFRCQKGDISLAKTCSYHPPEICNNISSTNSTIGLVTTTIGNSTAINVVPIVIPIVIGLIFIIGGLLLYRKYRCREGSRKSKIYICVPPDVTNREREKSSFGTENAGNNVEQSQIDHAADGLRAITLGLKNTINRDNALTVNEQAANEDQGHPSTDNRTSGASSEIQPTLSTSVSRTPSLKSNGSNKPLISP